MVRARIALTLACLVVGTASAAAVALAARQAADPPKPSPEAFLHDVVVAIARNDYATAWRTLHPSQQVAAPLQEYVSCESKSPIPGRLTEIDVLGGGDERMIVAGTREAVTTAAVTFRLVISDRGRGESVRVTHTVHAVQVDGRWRWMLPASRYEMYRANGCGYAPPR